MNKLLPVAGCLAMLSISPAFAQTSSQAEGQKPPSHGSGGPGPAMSSGNMGVPTTKTPAVTTTAPGGAGASEEVGGHSAASTSTAAGAPGGQTGK